MTPNHRAAGEENYLKCRRCLREFEVELDGSGRVDVATRGAFEKQQLRLSKLRNTLDFRSQQREREVLLGRQALPAADRQGSSQLTPAQIIEQASLVQDESKASVSRSLKLVEEARSVGATAAGQLHGQRERLESTDASANEMVQNIAQANREAAAYAAGMFDDSVQLFLVALIAIGLMFIGIMRLTEVGDDPPEDHRLQTRLITPWDEDPWEEEEAWR